MQLNTTANCQMLIASCFFVAPALLPVKIGFVLSEFFEA